jgi:hypothetical protein
MLPVATISYSLSDLSCKKDFFAPVDFPEEVPFSFLGSSNGPNYSGA